MQKKERKKERKKLKTMEIDMSDVFPKAKAKTFSNVTLRGKLEEHFDMFGVSRKEEELSNIIDDGSLEVLEKRNS